MDQCPRGYICINNYNAIGILIVFICVFFYFSKEYNSKIYNKLSELENNKNNSNENRPQIIKEIVKVVDNKPDTVLINKDVELMRNPLLPPHRRNYHIESNPIMGVPINIQTRGYDGGYQQIGMLYKEGISDENMQPGNNNDTNILPLFGKPLYSNSSKWLYYTGSDKFNNIKIPITVNGKDCTDDYGCKELYNDDIVNIPAYNGNFKVKIYKFDKPRYIPYV
jgi:hypothetical protein